MSKGNTSGEHAERFVNVRDTLSNLPLPEWDGEDENPGYAVPPGNTDVYESIVQERTGEGGFFVQTAGVHRADVLLAFAELAVAEAEALEDEHDGPPKENADLGAVRRRLEETYRHLMTIRRNVTGF